MITMEVKNLTVGYGKKIIVENQSFKLDKPEIISIIGANGSGKSTLLKTMARLLKPKSGEVLLDGENIFKLNTKEVARKVAMLPQSTSAPEDMTVERLVRIGRSPYKQFMKELGARDAEIVKEAMEATQILKYRDRPVSSLSGGERQRAWLALTLAQEPDILLLDEPTTYLDSHHQLSLMNLVRETHKKKGITVVMILHDLNLALRYSDRLIAVKDGAIVGDGSPQALMTKENLRDWFHIEADILMRNYDGVESPVCIPYEVSKP